MTIQETAKIIYMIHTAYPADRKATAEELADRIDLWAVFFRDYTVQEVQEAAQAWIISQTFMPTPKEIKESCDTCRKLARHLAGACLITGEGELTEDDAKILALFDSIQETANEADL